MSPARVSKTRAGYLGLNIYKINSQRYLSMKRLSFLLCFAVLAGVSAYASVIARSQDGDTLQCHFLNIENDSIFNNFLKKGINLSFSRKGESDYYAVVGNKTDTSAELSIHKKGTDWHIASIAYLITASDSIKRNGVWSWYDENNRLLYKETYDGGNSLTLEQFEYNTNGELLFSKFFERKKKNNKNKIFFTHVKAFYPSGSLAVDATLPAERTMNDSRGIMKVRPASTVCYDESGKEIIYSNTKQLQKAIQTYIQKNFRCPIVGNAVEVNASCDAILKTNSEGKVQVIAAFDNIIYHYVIVEENQLPLGELEKKVNPALQEYLRNELPSAEIKCKPATIDKTPIETIQYLTLTIRIKTKVF